MPCDAQTASEAAMSNLYDPNIRWGNVLPVLPWRQVYTTSLMLQAAREVDKLHAKQVSGWQPSQEFIDKLNKDFDEKFPK